MPIDEGLLVDLKLEEFTPSKILDHLTLIPEFFTFLKSKEKILGRSRALVTFITSVTVWAFKEKFREPLRKVSVELLEKLWESFKDRNKENIFDVPYKIEPNVWKYFLSLIYTEAQRDRWEKQELLRAATVYGPILIGCCFAFYPEDDLLNIERLWKEKS